MHPVDRNPVGADLAAYLDQVFGRWELVRDASWRHRASIVLEVADRTGQRRFGHRPASARTSRPAHAADGSDPSVHRQAGALLRRLHDAQPPLASPDFARERMAEFDTVAPHAALLLDEDLLGFVRITVGQLDRLPPPARVPCHLDYGPQLAHRSRDAVRHRLRMGPARSVG
jgi:hypothetical protein